MSNRRWLARERLEIYLVHLLMVYRRLILIVGLILLGVASAVIYIDVVAGYLALAPAMYLLLLSQSYNVTLYTARVVSWIGTLGSKDD